ncbi:MAG: type III-B CRISPR module RAMP protein Cmr4 [Methylococcaceae bacterium]|nr:type III-B CRISPR module RAMP protein Cmr4 [Methylococcaceae bacterium]
MATVSALLGLWAETSIHAGAGSSVDGIDLPIQREAHSDFPCVFGSSVKGALRAKAEDLWGSKNDSVRYVFGPDSNSDEASKHAGAIMVGDARLLLLPVRSLTGYFKWVTCPALLERLQRDASRLSVGLDDYSVPSLTENSGKALLPNCDGNDLFLEEYRLKTEADTSANLVAVLSKVSGISEELLNSQLAIVDNSMFTYLSRYATPVAAHIAIDNTKKVVKAGALWYEETLPPETVFYMALAANNVRDSEAKYDDSQPVKESKAQTVLNSITETLFADSPYLQVGGNETVGMGWCKVKATKGA